MIQTERLGPILVTGGAGFIGTRVCEVLHDAGEPVVSLDLVPPPPERRLDGVRYEEGSILDADLLDRIAAAHGVNGIVHLAALVIPACRAHPVQGAEINVVGHLNIMELARRRGIRRLVYTSSLAAKPRGEFDSPVNLYGVYKRCCEDVGKVYYLESGLASVGLRPNVVYGPGREQGETAAITLAIRAAALGEPYELPYSSRMCFQHVDEVADIIIRCLATSPQWPVVSDLTTEILSTDDLITTIRKVVPGARVTATSQLRAAPSEMDNAPLRALLGPWEAVSLEDGVRRTVTAFREQVSSPGP